jgi:serine/threonine protein kinase
MDASDFIRDEASLTSHSDEPIQDNGLVIEGRPRGLERIYDYEAGVHHPLHLHDVLHDRYRVIHKLGSGGYANVWLCRDISADSPKYVAVKIIMAESSTADCPEARVTKLVEAGCGQEVASEYFSLPLDKFDIQGPNGTHYAFVYPMLGSRVSRLTHLANLDDPGPRLREICSDIVQSMVTLHAHGICHGGMLSCPMIKPRSTNCVAHNIHEDFRPANILTQIGGLDGLSEEDVLKTLGTPQTTRVLTHDDESHDLVTAPQYLVYPVNWDDVLNDETPIKLSTGSACLTDFGESFEINDPPAEVGIPQVYCSPEQVLERRPGKASDLWALGCTLFEIRTGRKLFDTFDDDPDEYLYKVATILGKLPEPW